MADQILRIKDDDDNIYDIAEQRDGGTWAVASNDEDVKLRLEDLIVEVGSLTFGDASESKQDEIIASIDALGTQIRDEGNSAELTLADIDVGVPFVGDWLETRTAGIVRNLTILLSPSSPDDLGGTFTFQYAEAPVGQDPSDHVTISEVRNIGDLSDIRDFDLKNAGTHYRIIFEPSRTLNVGEAVIISTSHDTQYSGPFVRLANQQIEEQNATMPNAFAYLKAFGLDGISHSARLGGLDPYNFSQDNLDPSETYTGTYRDTSSYSSALAFVISDQPLDVNLRWSKDGVSTRPGLIGLSAVGETVFEDVLGPGVDLYVYLDVITTMVDEWVRIEATNTGTSATTIYEVDVWFYEGAFPGSYGGLDDSLSTLSTALLTRSVQAGTRPDGNFANFTLSGTDPNNSTETTLEVSGDIGDEWIGDWTEVLDFSHISIQASSTQLGQGTAEWSDDGSTVRHTNTTPLIGAGFFNLPTQGRYYRLRFINYSASTTDFFVSSTMKNAPASPYSVSIATPVDSSFPAQLVRSVATGTKPSGLYANVPVDGTLSSNDSEVSGELPTGATPAWDPAGPISAPNVIDTGWLPTEDYNYQSFHATFSIAGVKIFLLDAEDEQGNGSIYNTLQFAFPTATSSGLGTSVEVGAPFLNDYFRIIIINDSGSSCSEWDYRSRATSVAPGSVFLSLDQPILDFFPAPIVQSIIKGRQPDGDYESLPISGSDSGNTTNTPLGPNEEWVGVARDTTGFVGGMVLVESDVDSATDGIKIQFSETEDFTFVHKELSETFLSGGSDSAQPRFFPVMQGEYYRVSYLNGPIPQSRLLVRTELVTTPAQTSLAPMDAPLGGSNLSSMSRSAIVAPNDNDDWGNISRGTKGLHVAINEHEVETPIKPKSVWGSRGATVTSGAAVRLPVAPISGVGTISIQNEGAGVVYIGANEVDVKLAGRRRRVFSSTSVELDLSEAAEIWCIADSSEGAVVDTRLSGTTATGGSAPTDALTSNDVYATIASGNVLTVGGFTAPDVLDNISSVVIGFEGRIADGAPSTETVAFSAEYDVSGGNVGSLTSPTVAAISEGLYIASITRRNGSANVNSVTGLGLTWQQVPTLDITDDTGSNRISVWYAVGEATSGTVQAVFSATATNCTMKVTSWSGVDLTDPIYDKETLGVAGATISYSDSINGIAAGMAITFVTSARRVHTPTSGFTELTKVNTGTGPTDSRQSVSRRSLVATGTQAFSGTFSATADWVLAALVLRPRPTENPSVTLGYVVDGVPGDTSELIELTSGSDTEYTLNITSDLAWTATDIDNLDITIDGAIITSANVQIDYVFLDEQESEEGASQFVTTTVVGDV